MSEGHAAETFWNYFSNRNAPRLICSEALFELGFPFPVRQCRYDVRFARPEEAIQIADAQAEVALMESGTDPRERDAKGFLERVMRRIEQDRVFVVIANGLLIFKADVVARTESTAYLEGI